MSSGLLSDKFGGSCTKCNNYLPPSDFNDNGEYVGDHDCDGEEQ